jgi:hypothetical protein
MSKATTIRPPGVAAWLVDLFTPSDKAELILGDLLEEFSALGLKSGTAFARRWYWRQSVKTIAHLIGTGFRVSPFLIVGTAIAGYLLLGFHYWSLQHFIVDVISSYKIYAHVNVRVVGLIYFMLSETLMGAVVGLVVALIARGREIVSTMTLAVFAAATGAVFLASSGQKAEAFVGSGATPLVLAAFAVPIMILVGGVFVRKSRAAHARRASGV